MFAWKVLVDALEDAGWLILLLGQAADLEAKNQVSCMAGGGAGLGCAAACLMLLRCAVLL